jgi:DNA-binding MarR family transcriptional regulator
MTTDDKTKRALGAYHELARADDSIEAVMEPQLRKAGLGVGQFRVLERLLHGGPTPQAELCRHLFLSHSNISQVLDRLAARTWVVRRLKEGHKRQAMVHLTPQGRALIEGLLPKQAKLIRAQMAALTDREQDTLRKLCRKLSDGDALRFISELTADEQG